MRKFLLVQNIAEKILQGMSLLGAAISQEKNEIISEAAASKLYSTLSAGIECLNNFVKEKNPSVLKIAPSQTVWPAMVSKKANLTRFHSPLPHLNSLGTKAVTNIEKEWRTDTPISKKAHELISRAVRIHAASNFMASLAISENLDKEFVDALGEGSYKKLGKDKDDHELRRDVIGLLPLTKARLCSWKDHDRKWPKFLKKLFELDWKEDQDFYQKEFSEIIDKESLANAKTKIWDRIRDCIEGMLAD